jgi:hypothetical protein
MIYRAPTQWSAQCRSGADFCCLSLLPKNGTQAVAMQTTQDKPCPVCSRLMQLDRRIQIRIFTLKFIILVISALNKHFIYGRQRVMLIDCNDFAVSQLSPLQQRIRPSDQRMWAVFSVLMSWRVARSVRCPPFLRPRPPPRHPFPCFLSLQNPMIPMSHVIFPFLQLFRMKTVQVARVGSWSFVCQRPAR